MLRARHIATARLRSLGAQFTTSTSLLMPTNTDFPISPVPALKDGSFIRSAGCLIIGDEVLNGKTRDSNSNFLAKSLFDLAIELKRIEVIADDEEEISEAVTRMSKAYDLVITSGGIGPTHDDITYSSIAKAFNKDLEYHEETKRRMNLLAKKRPNPAEQTEEQKTARNRMALFPTDSEVLFVQEDLWVPVVRVNGNVCIFPGVPSLFERLVTAFLSRWVPLPPSTEKPTRVLIHTELPESSIAPFLTTLQERVKKELIRVGSYPKLSAGVDVSLIGKDASRLEELAEEVVKELQGEIILQGKLGEESK
ncbi:MoaB/Mog domain-containing protein [Leucosporidium creatinivorum]|uniref:MoaB/Mog domain-containing protein n=1 Tax=Leucosporidium creatinivorum TaxID=106004 RepID=A0A1Y2DPK4_9BASI|nr:MoaB/Mog domain-containing protein [Leucosporidium creatinivorum]